jgi:hypothetical protein
MIDEVPAIVPHAATVQSATPAPETPPGEVAMPLPSAEQVQAADRVFTAAAQPHALVTLFGVATSLALLRDLAVDTFDTSAAEEETEEKPRDTNRE